MDAGKRDIFFAHLATVCLVGYLYSVSTINIIFVYFQSGNRSLFLFIPITHDVSVMHLEYTTVTIFLRPV